MDLSIFNALLGELITPPAIVLILFLAVLALWLEKFPHFPTPFIPVLLLPVASIVYPQLASPGHVDYHCPNPTLILYMDGFIIGFISSLVQKRLLTWVINKFSPPEPTAQTPPPEPPKP